ncbi:hypothetical protein AC579_7540, partial [Pseudocercospora musae]
TTGTSGASRLTHHASRLTPCSRSSAACRLPLSTRGTPSLKAARPSALPQGSHTHSLQPTHAAPGSQRASEPLPLASALCLLLWACHGHGPATEEKRAARRTTATLSAPPWYHQILPLCSIHLLLSGFDDTCVRRSCHWLSSVSAINDNFLSSARPAQAPSPNSLPPGNSTLCYIVRLTSSAFQLPSSSNFQHLPHPPSSHIISQDQVINEQATATYSRVHHWPTLSACICSLAAICPSILTRTPQPSRPSESQLAFSERVEVFDTAQRPSFISAQHIKHGKARQMRTHFQDDQVRHDVDSMELQHVPLRPSLVHL